MVRHTQTICRQTANELSVFDYFVALALKGLNSILDSVLASGKHVEALLVEGNQQTIPPYNGNDTLLLNFNHKHS